eukprot:TRINITY_DN12956_c0_g2_i1.p2 TRINITY_DN12956_c0_g2~~TRINITY_DN12956_c0_g2_i1.p2  ORF type:complete len:109 (+),score=4.27 TRINITY_DN12956_c0_g2_i1:25-351(+)
MALLCIRDREGFQSLGIGHLWTNDVVRCRIVECFVGEDGIVTEKIESIVHIQSVFLLLLFFLGDLFLCYQILPKLLLYMHSETTCCIYLRVLQVTSGQPQVLIQPRQG